MDKNNADYILDLDVSSDEFDKEEESSKNEFNDESHEGSKKTDSSSKPDKRTIVMVHKDKHAHPANYWVPASDFVAENKSNKNGAQPTCSKFAARLGSKRPHSTNSIPDKHDRSIYCKLVGPNAKLPKKSSFGSAGFDLYCNKSVAVQPGEVERVTTGVSFSIPRNFFGKIFSR